MKLDKVLVWQRLDGGVSVTHLDDRDKLQNESDDQFIQRYSDKLKQDPLLSGSTLNVISSSDVPVDKTNRKHWSLIGIEVKVDETKVQAEEDFIAQKEADKQIILNRLGITKEEAAVLSADIIKG